VTIRFPLNIDDIVALNEYVFGLKYRRSLWMTILVVPVLSGPFIFAHPDAWPLLLLAMILHGFYIKIRAPHILREKLIKLLDGKHTAVGNHVLTIDESGIQDDTDETKVHVSWPTIEKIVQDKEYIFIFAGKIEAHIIPKNAFANNYQADVFYEKSLQLRKSTWAIKEI